MSAGQLEQFSCEGCGKSYRWKAELAGKRVKCKCGTAMTVPLPPQAKTVEESDDPFGDALSAMAEMEQSAQVVADLPRCPSCRSDMGHGATVCAQCGFNVNTGKSKKSKGAQAADVGGADGTFAVAPVAAMPLQAARASGTPLAYAGLPTRRAVAVANEGDNNIGEPFKDLYLPLGLFLLGIVLTFLEGRYGRGITNVQICMLFTAFVTTINLVLSIAGILMAVKLLDLGLGPIGPAMVKIAAVATLPGAVAGMLWQQMGFSGFFLIWVINLILIYAMFIGLLGLDFQETGICTCIIWVMRTWVGYALTFALLGAFGMSAGSGSSKTSIAMSSALSGPSSSTPKKPTPQKPRITAAKLEALCVNAMGQYGAVELRDWIRLPVPPNKGRSFPTMADIPPQRAADGVYMETGAKSILVTKILDDGRGMVPKQLVFVMPKEKPARRAITSWARNAAKDFGGASEIDNGQDHLLVDFDFKDGPAEWVDGGQYEDNIDESGGDNSVDNTAPGL